MLTSIYGIEPSKMERITLVRTHPKKRGLHAIQLDIPPNKDNSKRADANAIERIEDGSAHNGGIGVAAILKRDGKSDCILKLYLGTTEQHTVYEAELVGMIMGLHIIKRERRSNTSCVLNVNNRAALVAIKSEMKKSGQHLAASLIQSAKQLIGRRGSNNFRLMLRLDGQQDTKEMNTQTR